MLKRIRELWESRVGKGGVIVTIGGLLIRGLDWKGRVDTLRDLIRGAPGFLANVGTFLLSTPGQWCIFGFGVVLLLIALSRPVPAHASVEAPPFKTSRRRWPLVLGIGIVGVVAFALIPRRSHEKPRPTEKSAQPVNPQRTLNANPDIEIDPGTLTLYDLFERDFHGDGVGGSITTGLIFKKRRSPGQILVETTLVADFSRGVRLMKLYVPPEAPGAGVVEIAKYIGDNYEGHLKWSRESARIEYRPLGEPTATDSRDLPFSKIFYLYHEPRLGKEDWKAIRDFYGKKRLTIYARDGTYLALRRAQASKRPS